MSGYSKRREAATIRTKYRKGDRVRMMQRDAPWPHLAEAVVISVERGEPGSISSSGVSLWLRGTDGRSFGSDGYWWTKVRR